MHAPSEDNGLCHASIRHTRHEASVASVEHLDRKCGPDADLELELHSLAISTVCGLLVSETVRVPDDYPTEETETS